MAARALPYCGNLQARPGDLVRRDPAGGVLPLFAGRRAGFSFSTRVALRRACDLLGLKPGDEVLAPAYNCGSELDPLRAAGLALTLYPVDRRTRIDPDAVEQRITARTRAVYVTHYFGVLHPETATLRALCDRHGLALIEDCALSLLSGVQPAEGAPGGGLGDVAVFCFYKFFPTLAGGVLVINTDRIPGPLSFPAPAPRQAAIRHLARMGLDSLPGARGLLQRLRPRPDAPDLTPAPGSHPDMPGHYYFDPGLTDAGISGLTARTLRSFDVAATIAARRAHYCAWLDALTDLPGVRPLFPDLAPETCPLSLPVLIAPDQSPGRNALAAALTARGIAATPWWAGYNRHLEFAGQTDACHLKDHVLSLPVHQQLGPGAVEHMARALHALLSPGSRPPTAAPDRRPAAAGP